MRILVLGCLGMLGHQVALRATRQHETWGTVRSKADEELAANTLAGVSIYSGVDGEDFSTVENAIREIKPTAIVNCIGIIKQDGLAKSAVPSIRINALLPNLLEQHCRSYGIRLVHVSTDCVFSGKRGMYSESDRPDCEDLYGQSKLLGEVYDHALTLRTSIIGPELRSNRSLLNWFLSQENEVRGYTRAIFSGLSTLELSRIIVRSMVDWPNLQGLYQVSADPISKHDLLSMINRAYGKELNILPDDELVIDRSLDSTRFRNATGYQPPSWQEMVAELAANNRLLLAGGNYVTTR